MDAVREKFVVSIEWSMHPVRFPLIGGDVGTDRIYGTVVTFYFFAVPAFLSDGDDYGGGGNFLVGLLWLTIALCLGERWNL